MKSVLIIQVLFSAVFAFKTPVTSKKSKLCGNEKCDEVLFKAKVTRVMDSTHEAFLSLTEGALVDVTAVKFSDRTDLMEGVLADGTKGNFYIGAIDIGGYIEFLKNAVRQKKELKEISQKRDDVGSKELLGTVRADLHLVRDYNVQAVRYAQEHNLPEPELFPLPDAVHSSVSTRAHSHSHEGGHSTHPHYASHSHRSDRSTHPYESSGFQTELIGDESAIKESATTASDSTDSKNVVPVKPEGQHMKSVSSLDAMKSDSSLDASSLPPLYSVNLVGQVRPASSDKAKETHNSIAADAQGDGLLVKSNSLTLRPSNMLSSNDFDIPAAVSDVSAYARVSIDEFRLREKCSCDSATVSVDADVHTTEGSHCLNIFGAQQELYNRSSTVHGILKSLSGAMRTVPFMNAVDDTGIGFVINLSLLVAAVVFHSISYFLSDIGEPIAYDSMIAYDLGTTCKYLDELSKAKDLEKSSCEILKSKIEEERLSHEGLEAQLEFHRKRAAQAEDCVAELRRRIFDSEQSHISAVNELSCARLASEGLERELFGEKQLNKEVVADLKKANETALKLRTDLQCAEEEIKKLALEKSRMELENAMLSSLVEEAERMRKEGSGGSGGWSDFGEDIVEQVDAERERTPTTAKVTPPVTNSGPAIDVRELTKLRVQLRKAEHELEIVRVALENEKEERHRADTKLTSLQHALERRTREVEERDRDRSRADERCNELLALVKDSNVKVKETEQLRDKLLDDIAKMENELASKADDRRKKEEKISDLELELKRMRCKHLKLETRRFNEVLELKHKLDIMQTNQLQPIASMAHDYEFLTNAERNIAPSPTFLWEEATSTETCNRPPTPEEDLFHGVFARDVRGSSRARRSYRAQLSDSPSEREKRKESSHRRVRSRSHGRFMWNGRSSDTSSQHNPVEPAFPHSFPPLPEYEMKPTIHRRNRTAYVCHSSCGSYGAPSPHPEMPLLSNLLAAGPQKLAGKQITDPELNMKPCCNG